MKKLPSFLILLVITLFFTGCSQKSNEELIVGKWQVIKADFSQIPEYNEATEKEKLKLEMMEVAFRKIQLEYFADKTYIMSGNNDNISDGTYTFLNDGKFIEMKSTNQSLEKHLLLKLSEDSLIFKAKEGIVLVCEKSK
jgi:PBP1b-binding outer membrane lipoprotein LpoB